MVRREKITKLLLAVVSLIVVACVTVLFWNAIELGGLGLCAVRIVCLLFDLVVL